MELIVTMRQDIGLATVSQDIIHRFDGWQEVIEAVG